MAGYSYPVLTIPELVNSLQEMQIEISENDIKSPDPRRWHQLYGCIFEMLRGKQIEQATQALCRRVQFESDHPEIVEEGFAQLAYTLCLQRTFCGCGYQNFSIADVISPSKSSLVKMLSAFVNFSIHRSMRQEFFDEEKQALLRSRERYDAVVSRQKELKSRFERMEETRKQRESEKQQLQDELDQYKQRVMELHKQQEGQTKYLNELDLKKSEMENEKESIKQRIKETQQESDKLSQKIVHSPDRFKQEQDRLKKRITDMKDDLSRKDKVLSENRKLLELTKRKEMAAEKAVKITMEAQESREAENKIDAELLKLDDRKNEHTDKTNQLYKLEEDLSEKMNVRKEQKRNLTKLIDVNKQDSYHKLMEFKQLKEKKVHHNQSIKAETKDIENSSNNNNNLEIRQQLEELKKDWQKEYNNRLSEISDLTKQAEDTIMYCCSQLSIENDM